MQLIMDFFVNRTITIPVFEKKANLVLSVCRQDRKLL